MIVELWDDRDFSQITYNMVWDIFKIEGRSDYLYANVPLWFLLAIFVIQFIGLWIFRLPKWAVLLFAVSVIFLRDEILSIPTPFMINNGLYWFGFFALGYLFGKPFMGYITGLKHKLIVLTSSLAVALTCIYIGHMGLFNSNPYSSYLLNISLVIFLLTIASFFNGMKSVNFLRFLGVNTLLILCTHLWFLTPISRLSFKLTNIHAPGLGIILTIITSVIMIPFINFINKRFPILSGK